MTSMGSLDDVAASFSDESVIGCLVMMLDSCRIIFLKSSICANIFSWYSFIDLSLDSVLVGVGEFYDVGADWECVWGMVVQGTALIPINV